MCIWVRVRLSYCKNVYCGTCAFARSDSIEVLSTCKYKRPAACSTLIFLCHFCFQIVLKLHFERIEHFTRRHLRLSIEPFFWKPIEKKWKSKKKTTQMEWNGEERTVELMMASATNSRTKSMRTMTTYNKTFPTIIKVVLCINYTFY